jgi:hypothetical protein
MADFEPDIGRVGRHRLLCEVHDKHGFLLGRSWPSIR